MSTVPIDISYRNSVRSGFHRDSFAHSQGMGGISWGGVSVGSWLREEVMLNNMNAPQPASHSKAIGSMSMSPDVAPAYFPALEADFCRDYTCCGQVLPTLHDLLGHYEESHITPSPPVEAPVARRGMQNLEMVSTNEVFLGLNGGSGVGGAAAGAAVSRQGNSQLGGNGGSGLASASGSQLGTGFGANSHIAGAGPSIAHDPLGLGSLAQQGVKDDEEDMCIDDPARQLYVIERSDNKPYKCPVVGCDKTYKNQNGLKYHRLHGHQNQTLHLNEDGTYSIIDPLSNTPYPDGMGMERDKPYRCEICGKRYKNLNGLKYHRAHSTH